MKISITNAGVSSILAIQQIIEKFFGVGKGALLYADIEDRKMEFSAEKPELFLALKAKFGIAFSATHKTDFVVEFTLFKAHLGGNWNVYSVNKLIHEDLGFEFELTPNQIDSYKFDRQRERFIALLGI